MAREMRLPFEGFYYSVIDSFIDEEVECLLQDDNGNQKLSEESHDAFWNAYGFPKEFWLEIAKKYVDCYKIKYDEEAEEYLPIRFKALERPKEYNFDTDRIFVEIPNWFAVKMREEFSDPFYALKGDDSILRNYIKGDYSDCSGFMSFYSNDLDDWPEDVQEWDHNQLYTLFRAYCDLKGVAWLPDPYDLWEDARGNGVLSNLVWEYLPEECQDIINGMDLADSMERGEA